MKKRLLIFLSILAFLSTTYYIIRNPLIGKKCYIQYGDKGKEINGKIQKENDEWIVILRKENSCSYYREFWIPKKEVKLIHYVKY